MNNNTSVHEVILIKRVGGPWISPADDARPPTLHVACTEIKAAIPLLRHCLTALYAFTLIKKHPMGGKEKRGPSSSLSHRGGETNGTGGVALRGRTKQLEEKRRRWQRRYRRKRRKRRTSRRLTKCAFSGGHYGGNSEMAELRHWAVSRGGGVEGWGG